MHEAGRHTVSVTAKSTDAIQLKTNTGDIVVINGYKGPLSPRKDNDKRQSNANATIRPRPKAKRHSSPSISFHQAPNPYYHNNAP
jgi:hypothetical protein